MSKNVKSKDKLKKLKTKNGVFLDDYLEKINEILNNFNFKRVRLVLETLNWKWWSPSVEDGEIPSIERMQQTAHHLILEVATTKNVVCSTGGFYAYRHCDDTLELAFIVEHYETDPF